MRSAHLVRLGRDTRGVTLVEFAIVLPVLCVVLFGIFEMGYRAYVASIVQGALHEAARMATVGGVTPDQIDAHVKAQLRSFSQNATITTEVESYYDYTGVRQPEKITQDTEPTGEYNEGDCYEDANGNEQYDLDRGRSGTGNADDVVRYEVTMSFPHVFPVAGFLGWEDDVTIQSNTMLRNQPFAARVNSTVVRC